MKTLTRPELIAMLENVSGTTFISVETDTEQKTKKDCPYKNIRKISKVSGAIGVNYQNSVNNQLKRENLPANFKAEQRTWGKRVSGPIIEYKGKKYLEVKVQSASSDLFSGNQRLTLDNLKNWMYNIGKSRQGVQKEVILRDYSIDNITRITINNEEYSVV